MIRGGGLEGHLSVHLHVKACVLQRSESKPRELVIDTIDETVEQENTTRSLDSSDPCRLKDFKNTDSFAFFSTLP